jgi:hypothetical protein
MHAGCFQPGARISVAPEAAAPNPLRQLGAVAGALGARLEAYANKDQWAIGVIERPIARVLEGIDPEAVRWLPPPDGSRGYGEAVVINRIDVLTPEAYVETPVARIAPDPAGPYPHGLHTISAAGEWTLIDGKRERRSLRGLLPLLRGARR